MACLELPATLCFLHSRGLLPRTFISRGGERLSTEEHLERVLLDFLGKDCKPAAAAGPLDFSGRQSGTGVAVASRIEALWQISPHECRIVIDGICRRRALDPVIVVTDCGVVFLPETHVECKRALLSHILGVDVASGAELARALRIPGVPLVYHLLGNGDALAGVYRDVQESQFYYSSSAAQHILDKVEQTLREAREVVDLPKLQSKLNCPSGLWRSTWVSSSNDLYCDVREA